MLWRLGSVGVEHGSWVRNGGWVERSARERHSLYAMSVESVGCMAVTWAAPILPCTRSALAMMATSGDGRGPIVRKHALAGTHAGGRPL